MASLPYLSPDATPSPANPLRRAAAQMREAFADVAPDYEDAFYLAVADMLVERADAFEKWARQGGGQARIIPHEFVTPFAVARAYLGESV